MRELDVKPRGMTVALRSAFALCLIFAAKPGESVAQARSGWAGAWGYAPADANPTGDRLMPAGTYRYRVELTQSGSALALTFSNAEGTRPVSIAKASVAPARGDSGVEFDERAARPLSFSGRGNADLPIGRAVLSDAVELPSAVGQDFIVSVTFSTQTQPSYSGIGLPMAFAGADGRFEPLKVRPYLTLVSVRDPGAPCTIVAYGDSITDGAASDSLTMRGWPGRLAERLAKLPARQRCGVVNMGIGGNRVLENGRAISAIDRFWRDVASVPGVTHVILLEGINDIGASGYKTPMLTPTALIEGYRQIIARGHALGYRMVGATMTPAREAGYMSPAKDEVRDAVNSWVRSGNGFDDVVDFDKATRDPAKPFALLGRFDPGDHLHPNDDGYRAMGDAIDLRIFQRR